jgi:hypothetical protein
MKINFACFKSVGFWVMAAKWEFEENKNIPVAR